MKRWEEWPGPKIPVITSTLETYAEHTEDPERWGYMLREHARTIRKQIEAYDLARMRQRSPEPKPPLT